MPSAGHAWLSESPLAAVAIALAAVALGVAVAQAPALALLPLVAIGGLVLLLSPLARVVFFVFGMIFVFGTTDELTPLKLAYLAGLGAVTIGSLLHLRTLLATPAVRAARPLLVAAVLLVGLVLVSFPSSFVGGTSPKAWLRDSAPYVMTAIAIVLAVEAQDSLSARTLRRLLVAAGLLGATAFAVVWLERRGLGTLGLEKLGFPTVLLGAALFAFAMSATIQGSRHRTAWILTAGVTFALLVSTGTRTSLVLLVAPFAIAFGSGRQLAQRSLRLLIAVPVLVILVFLGAQSILKVVNADEAVIQSRIQALFSSGSETDRSYIERVNATSSAWDLFAASPLLGAGPGTEISRPDSFGREIVSTSVDSPVLFLTRFGLLGFVWLAVFVAAYIGVVRRLARAHPNPTVSQLALVGFGAIVAFETVLLVPFEDKGFSAALLLLLAIALKETIGSRPTQLAQ